MTDVGALTVAGVLVASVLTAYGIILNVQSRRITEMEQKVLKAESQLAAAKNYNRRLWLFCRNLIDLYYRHRRDGSPDPPGLPEEDTDTTDD